MFLISHVTGLFCVVGFPPPSFMTSSEGSYGWATPPPPPPRPPLTPSQRGGAGCSWGRGLARGLVYPPPSFDRIYDQISNGYWNSRTRYVQLSHRKSTEISVIPRPNVSEPKDPVHLSTPSAEGGVRVGGCLVVGRIPKSGTPHPPLEPREARTPVYITTTPTLHHCLHPLCIAVTFSGKVPNGVQRAHERVLPGRLRPAPHPHRRLLAGPPPRLLSSPSSIAGVQQEKISSDKVWILELCFG